MIEPNAIEKDKGEEHHRLQGRHHQRKRRKAELERHREGLTDVKLDYFRNFAKISVRMPGLFS